MNTQAELPMKRAFRPVLVDIYGAVAALKYDADSVRAMVDAGELRHVFDISAADAPARGTHNRELRFWLAELLERAQGATDARLAELCIVGHDHFAELSTYTVEQILLCNRAHVKRLVGRGLLAARKTTGGYRIERDSLRAFLARRRVG